MNTDVFFTKGSTHKICQDYALSSEGTVILSDGCSSAADTDFGSRLLCKAAAQHLDCFDKDNPAVFSQRVISTAAATCRALDLSVDSLYATLLFAQIKDGKTTFSVFGDGYVLCKWKDGSIRVIKITFPFNSPFYLRYCLTLGGWRIYKNNVGLEYTMTCYTILPDGGIENSDQNIVRGGLKELEPIFFSYTLDKEYDFMAICSDGLGSFVRSEKTNTTVQTIPVAEEDVIKEIMAFKNCQGEFVWRRMTKAFKVFEEKGWRNTDDFSIGVIAL
jgi:hypothetical protein